MRENRLSLSMAIMTVLLAAACSAPAPAASPSAAPTDVPTPTPTEVPTAAPSDAPTPTPTEAAAVVDSAEAAAQLVLASDPRFAGIGPLDPELIGQSAWYEVAPTTCDPIADCVWMVKITVGWGDCPAGCINRHHWRYLVGTGGSVALIDESGDDLDGKGESEPVMPRVVQPPRAP
jgi:hypothetical protein